MPLLGIPPIIYLKSHVLDRKVIILHFFAHLVITIYLFFHSYNIFSIYLMWMWTKQSKVIIENNPNVHLLFLQRVIATDTRNNVDSTTTFTNYQEKFLEGFVWIAVTSQVAGIVITAKKGTTEILSDNYTTGRFAKAS